MAIALNTAGNGSITSGATTFTVDITAAATGATVFLMVGIGVNEASCSATGWTQIDLQNEAAATAGAIYYRVKQAGDTTFLFTAATSSKMAWAWSSYTGLAATPFEAEVWLATSTSQTSIPTGSSTPTTTGRWALAGFYSRNTSAAASTPTWSAPAGMTQRAYGSDSASVSSPWLGTQICDTNGTVTATSQSYTGTVGPAAQSHSGAFLLFLVPAGAGATAIPTQQSAPTPRRLPFRARTRATLPVPAQLPVVPTYRLPPVRKRSLLTMQRRGRSVLPAPAQVSVVPTYRLPPVTKRRVLTMQRRGRTVQPAPAQIPVTPQYQPPRSVRRPAALLRRGHAWVVVPAQAVAPAPYVPQTFGRRRLAMLGRRGRSSVVVPVQASPPSDAPVRRPQVPRRGSVRVASPPIPQAAPVTVYVPAAVGRRRVAALARRGRAAQVVPPQAPVTPQYAPPPVTKRRLAAMARRRQAVQVTPAQTAPVPPALVSQTVGRRRLAALQRRGDVAIVTPPQIAPPAPAYAPLPASRRRVGAFARRARVAAPVPAQAVPPAVVEVHPRLPRRPRIRTAVAVVPVQATPPPPYPRQTRRSVRVIPPARTRVAEVVPVNPSPYGHAGYRPTQVPTATRRATSTSVAVGRITTLAGARYRKTTTPTATDRQPPEPSTRGRQP